jgi:thiamine pyrophosphate-dependent acetolactate synthase large subunit-like protein
MTDARENDKAETTNWVDDEFAGEHGTTASPSSVEDEKAPDFRPQNAHQAGEKIKEESADQPGVLGKAKEALKEVDRQVAGEYEKRDDRDAPEEVQEHTEASRPNVRAEQSSEAPPDAQIASAAVDAEAERFDGLVNESGNPARQPALDH